MASPAAPPFEQTVDVETPELVVLTYSIAGLGSRVLAGLTDLLIFVGAMMVLGIVLAIFGDNLGRMLGRAAGSWGIAFFVLLQFAVFWGYFVLFEGLMDGQTPGKRLHRLRVVRDGGYSVGFAASAARNLVRLIDMQPAFIYMVGIGSILFTKHGRRLGDIVAGTIVVREEPRAIGAPAARAGRAAAPAALQTALTEDEFVMLSRLVERWSSLEPLRRKQLVDQVAVRFARALPDDARPPSAKLLELHEREQRARAAGVASRDETGAGRERQAIISAQAPRWHAFAARLATAQKSGLKSLGEAGVREFVAEYRALAADLARLRTAAGGRSLDELFQLGRLVGGAHNLLYRDRGMPLRAAVRILFSDVPREIRRSVVPISIAAIMLFGPGIVSAVAVLRHPGVAVQLLPQSMLQRAESGVRRAKNGDGYIDDPQLFRPVMASTIVANNVQVTFGAFAGGITAGLLTTFMLVGNGISIGSVAGLYMSKNIGRLLLAFVAPHGVLELFAICVAGGGGLLLAAALLVPGARTRRDALVQNGRRAMRLIAGSTLLLVIAGALEGLVSPIEWWPLEGKLAVSGVTAVLLVTWLRLGRGTLVPADAESSSPARAQSLALGPVTAPRAP